MADVFAVPVEVVDNTGSAALGAALRAWQADQGLPWSEVVDGFTDAELRNTNHARDPKM